MKIVRQIVTMLLSFCLMFLIMIICLLSGIPSFLNPDTYHEILDEANAYKLIQEQIQNSLDDMLLVNNIELKTLENFITVDEVKEFVSDDVNSLLTWIKGSDEKVKALDLTRYESRFDERLSDFFRDNHYFLDESAKNDVEIMKQNTIQFLKGYLRLIDFEKLSHSEQLTKVTKMVELIDFKLLIGAVSMIAIVFIGLIIACIPSTTKTDEKSLHSKLRQKIEDGLLWSGYGILAGGLIIFTIFFSGVQSGFYQHTAIQLQYLKQSLALLIEQWFVTLYTFGLIATGIGVLCMIPYWSRLYKEYMKD